MILRLAFFLSVCLIDAKVSFYDKVVLKCTVYYATYTLHCYSILILKQEEIVRFTIVSMSMKKVIGVQR